MKKARLILMLEFWIPLAVCLLLVILFESDILPVGWESSYGSKEFFIAVVMELMTICAIPLALRLFKFKRVHRALTADQENRERNLLKWGSYRMGMLCIPMLLNTLFYYMFMNVAFGYMGIILALCLFFVYPSLRRCHDETASQ